MNRVLTAMLFITVFICTICHAESVILPDDCLVFWADSDDGMIALNDYEMRENMDLINDEITIIIPSQLDGEEVVGIDEYGFAETEAYRIVEVQIQEGIRQIGTYAFDGSQYLKSVLLPDSLETIGDYAFDTCRELQDIFIPRNVSSIGCNPFIDCYKLSCIEVDTRNNCFRIIEGALVDINSSRIISLPCDMQAKRYELPKGIEAVGAYALEHCDNIAEIIIPSTIIKLEEGALAYCNSLDQVVFHEGLLEIGDSAFEGCDFLSIELPESLETIGSQAFCYCENLVSIYIPPNVSFIGEDAFLYSEDVVIQCKADSYAQEYAIENDIPFLIVE